MENITNKAKRKGKPSRFNLAILAVILTIIIGSIGGYVFIKHQEAEYEKFVFIVGIGEIAQHILDEGGFTLTPVQVSEAFTVENTASGEQFFSPAYEWGVTESVEIGFIALNGNYRILDSNGTIIWVGTGKQMLIDGIAQFCDGGVEAMEVADCQTYNSSLGFSSN